MEKQLYNIVMLPGVPELDLLENEASGMELKINPDLFDGLITMKLTEEEAETIISSGKVQECRVEKTPIDMAYPTTTPKYETGTVTYRTRYIPSGAPSTVGADNTGMNMYFTSEFDGQLGALDSDYNKGSLGNVTGNGSDFFKREVTTNGVRIMGAGGVGGQTAVPDAWLEKVARMFELFLDPTGTSINLEYQRQMIKTLSGDIGTYHAGKQTIQRVARGAGADYSPNFLTDSGIESWNLTELFDTHVQNDMVWYLNSTGDGYGDGDIDAQEVIEHVFHTLHMHGLPADDIKLYAFLASDWASGDLYAAMEEAYDAGKWDPSGYNSPSNAWKTDSDAFEVAAKEYLFLLNFAMFEYTSLWDGGSLAPEWTDDMRTQSGIQSNNPLGYAFFNTYIAPVISKPTLTTIRNIFQDGNTPSTDNPENYGTSGYVATSAPGYSSPIGWFGDYRFDGTVKSNFVGDYVDIVAIEAGTPNSAYANHINHVDFAELNDPSTPKFIPMDWSSVSSSLNDDRNNQITNPNDKFSSHAIGVLSAAGGKFCSWGKNSSLRVIYLSDGVTAAYYGALQWHISKPVNPATGVRNATVVTGAWGYNSNHQRMYRCDHIQALDVFNPDTGINTVINRPVGNSWGTDLTPFTDNMFIPRVVQDPTDGLDYWCISVNEETRQSFYDTIMAQFNNYNGIYHFKSAGNDTGIAVDPEDARWNNKIIVGVGANGILNTTDSEGRIQLTSITSSNALSFYPLRTEIEGGANQFTIAACQQDDVNRLMDDYSTRGPMIDFAAYGAYTWTSSGDGTTYADGKWGYFSGTSCAAPVAASCAIVFLDWYFTQKGVYPSIAELKALMKKHAKANLIGEDLFDFSNTITAGDYGSAKLYNANEVNRIKDNNYMNGGSELTELCGTPPLRVHIPWGIRMGSGKYIAGGSEQTSEGRRPISGRAWPRPKVSFSS